MEFDIYDKIKDTLTPDFLAQYLKGQGFELAIEYERYALWEHPDNRIESQVAVPTTFVCSDYTRMITRLIRDMASFTKVSHFTAMYNIFFDFVQQADFIADKSEASILMWMTDNIV